MTTRVELIKAVRSIKIGRAELKEFVENGMGYLALRPAFEIVNILLTIIPTGKELEKMRKCVVPLLNNNRKEGGD